MKRSRQISSVTAWAGDVVLRIALLATLVAPATSQTIVGVGDPILQPVFARWSERYRKVDSTVKVRLRPANPGTGGEYLVSGKVDFLATSVPLTPDQVKAAGGDPGLGLLHIPIGVGGVVPVYNVEGIDTGLKFTAAALSGIFLGRITRWNDPELVNANPSVPLVDVNKRIVVVHRSDKSDTTYLWADYLSVVNPEWKAGPGRGVQVEWPIGVGVKTDDGVQDLVIGPVNNYGIDELVSNVPNSIGYLHFRYALDKGLPYGDVQNRAGRFVRATRPVLGATADSVAQSISDGAPVSLTDNPAETAYPIASFVWMIVPARIQDKTKAKAIASFLAWVLKEGQTDSEVMNYGKLPPSVVERAMAEAARIQ
jgi:phosphate transport system substrate-binding protein